MSGSLPSRSLSLLQALADATSVAMEKRADLRRTGGPGAGTNSRVGAGQRGDPPAFSDRRTDGLINRRGFYPLAEAALNLARRHHRSCVLAFLDVDGLKRVNDAQGHEVGDALLRMSQKCCAPRCAVPTSLARMGGDEFCVLVTEPQGDTGVLRERIFAAFQRFNETQNRPFRLSASIGLVEAWPTDFATLDQLLAHADELMYREKRPKPIRDSRTDLVRVPADELPQRGSDGRGAYAASKRRVSIPPLCHVEIVDAVPADGLAVVT